MVLGCGLVSRRGEREERGRGSHSHRALEGGAARTNLDALPAHSQVAKLASPGFQGWEGGLLRAMLVPPGTHSSISLSTEKYGPRNRIIGRPVCQFSV